MKNFGIEEPEQYIASKRRPRRDADSGIAHNVRVTPGAVTDYPLLIVPVWD